MYAAEQHGQEIWPGDRAQGGSVVPTLSGATSDFDNFTSDNVGGKQPSGPSSSGNEHRGTRQTPGVVRTGELLLRNGPGSTLPAEKAFAIQIGWRLFRLSGASIMSDGELGAFPLLLGLMLTLLKRLRISRPILRNS